MSLSRWIPVLLACLWAVVSVRSGGAVDAMAHRGGAHGPGVGFHVHVHDHDDDHGHHHHHHHHDHDHDHDHGETSGGSCGHEGLAHCCDAGDAVPTEGSAVAMLLVSRVVTAGAEPVVPEAERGDAGAERALWLGSASGVRPSGARLALRSVVLTT